MLIGINLNHPVSQYPRQQTNLGGQPYGDSTSCSSAQVVAPNSQYHGQISQSMEQQNGLNASTTNGRRETNFFYGDEKRQGDCKKTRKQLEMTVQTFEYQPYPVLQIEQHPNLSNECRNYGVSANVGPCHNDYYHGQQSHNNVDKQMVTVSKQTGDCNYPTYQFNAFNNEYQQHYQYQNVPYELSAHNNGYYA